MIVELEDVCVAALPGVVVVFWLLGLGLLLGETLVLLLLSRFNVIVLDIIVLLIAALVCSWMIVILVI